jgi:hypothetical protein
VLRRTVFGTLFSAAKNPSDTRIALLTSAKRSLALAWTRVHLAGQAIEIEA